jgi:hypothetical protein
VPDVDPVGVEGAEGGLLMGASLLVMLIDNGSDQLDSIPFSSMALTRISKAFDPEATVHLLATVMMLSGFTRHVVAAVPSPQSNVYLI